MKKEVKEDKKDNKKKIIICIVVLLILIILLFLFFNRKFEVQYIYNNGDTEAVAYVKYLRRAPKDLAKEDITYEGYTLLGYYETYYLNGKEIETIKKDSEKENSICKTGFALNTEKVKCISETKFDFENTKIKKDTTIEALWSKNDEPQPVPQTTTTTTTKSVDKGTISLSASNSCLVKGQSTVVTASVRNAKDNVVTWSNDACLSLSGSGNSRTVSGNGCGAHPTVTARLKNGASNAVTLNYEDTLSVSVTKNGSAVTPTGGVYKGNSLTITTNVPAYITGNYLTGDAGSLRTSASTTGASDTTVTIKTPCGQTRTVSIQAIIN